MKTMENFKNEVIAKQIQSLSEQRENLMNEFIHFDRHCMQSNMKKIELEIQISNIDIKIDTLIDKLTQTTI